MSAHFFRAEGGSNFLYIICTATFTHFSQILRHPKTKRFLNPQLPLKSMDIWTFFLAASKTSLKSIAYKKCKTLTTTKTRDFLPLQDFNCNKTSFVYYLSNCTKTSEIIENKTRQHFN